jgi:hypothetical protein
MIGADEAQGFREVQHSVLFKELSDYLKGLQSHPHGPDADRELARACWALALYETIFRAPTGIDSPLWTLTDKSKLSDLLDLANPAWIDDVQAMSRAAEVALVAAFPDVDEGARMFGPVFAGSRDVGGADADILLGTCLVEVKATTQTSLEKKWVYQLAAYALLDYDDKYQIDEVALYLARQALLIRWPLSDYLRRMRPVDRSQGLSKPKVDVASMRTDLHKWLSGSKKAGSSRG